MSALTQYTQGQSASLTGTPVEIRGAGPSTSTQRAPTEAEVLQATRVLMAAGANPQLYEEGSLAAAIAKEAGGHTGIGAALKRLFGGESAAPKKAKFSYSNELAADYLARFGLFETATGINWRYYFAGWLLNFYESRGNVSVVPRGGKGRTDEVAVWRSGENLTDSTVLCIAPKVAIGGARGSGKQPAKDGYVMFDIPKYWIDAGKEMLGHDIFDGQKKISVHLMAMIAGLTQPPPENVGNEGYDSSHVCGNPWCVLHCRFELRRAQQTRSVCFEHSPAKLAIACTGHGIVDEAGVPVYCARHRAAVLPDGMQLAEVGGRHMDDREVIRNAWVHRLFTNANQERVDLCKQIYASTSGSGRGRTGIVGYLKTLTDPKYARKNVRDLYTRFVEAYKMKPFDSTAIPSALQKAAKEAADAYGGPGPLYASPSPARAI